MLETKPANIHTKMLRGNWTEESALKAVSSWLRLSTSKDDSIDIVGARTIPWPSELGRRSRKIISRQAPLGPLLFTGCDGLPKTGQTWVRNNILKATVVVPANTGLALEMVVKAIRTGVSPPETAFTDVSSYPAVEALGPGKKK